MAVEGCARRGRRRGVAKVEDLVPTSSRAVAEYLSVLDDAALAGDAGRAESDLSHRCDGPPVRQKTGADESGSRGDCVGPIHC